MSAELLATLKAAAIILRERIWDYTEEDWHDALVLAYKLTAEVKVERANKPNGPWLLSS